MFYFRALSEIYPFVDSQRDGITFGRTGMFIGENMGLKNDHYARGGGYAFNIGEDYFNIIQVLPALLFSRDLSIPWDQMYFIKTYRHRFIPYRLYGRKHVFGFYKNEDICIYLPPKITKHFPQSLRQKIVD